MICKMFTKILKITIQIKNVFDDMIADIINNNKKTKSSSYRIIYWRPKSLIFVSQCYFKILIFTEILNSTHFFIMKYPNKRELQQIALNHSSNIDFKDFTEIYKKCTTEPYSF